MPGLRIGGLVCVRVAYRLLCGHYPFQSASNEETLRMVFSEIGKVVSVRLLNEKDGSGSQRPRGHGFVDFEGPVGVLLRASRRAG